jgi:hypothetical protein
MSELSGCVGIGGADNVECIRLRVGAAGRLGLPYLTPPDGSR